MIPEIQPFPYHCHNLCHIHLPIVQAFF
jgi:hypothetical protein